jgi:hypothetical protein
VHRFQHQYDGCAGAWQALPKRLGSSVLTGPMLAGLASTYVTAINNGAVPVIATAWQVHTRPY